MAAPRQALMMIPGLAGSLLGTALGLAASAYLQSHGVTAAQIAKLQDLALE